MSPACLTRRCHSTVCDGSRVRPPGAGGPGLEEVGTDVATGMCGGWRGAGEALPLYAGICNSGSCWNPRTMWVGLADIQTGNWLAATRADAPDTKALGGHGATLVGPAA
jgi:hypothetical protein